MQLSFRVYILAGLAALPASVAHSQSVQPPACRAFISQHYKSCSHPTHPKIYPEKVSAACPALTHKACRGEEAKTRETVDVSFIYKINVPETSCSLTDCREGGKWDFTKHTIALCGAPLRPNPSRNDILSALRETTQTADDMEFSIRWDKGDFKITNVGALEADGSRQITCARTISVEVPVVGNYPSCGADTYTSCRHHSHGPQFFENIRSAACGLEPGRISVEESPRATRATHRVSVCATLNEVAETTAPEAWSKTVKLRENLDLLATSTLAEASARSAAGSAARITILAELERLSLKATKLDTPDKKRAEELSKNIRAYHQPEITALIAAYGKGYADRKQGMSDVEAAFDRAFYRQQFYLAERILEIYPKDAAVIAKKTLPIFASESSRRYALLFPNGVTYGVSLLDWAQKSLNAGTDEHLTYRMAEATVRAELAQSAKNQARTLKLLDLRYQALRPTHDFSNLLAELKSAAVREADLEELRLDLDELKSDRARLVQTVVTFLDAQIKIRERERVRQLEALWKFVERAKAISKDARFEVLTGYKALVELDAPAFNRALQASVAHLPSHRFPNEFLTTSRGLISTADKYLLSLRELRSLLDRTASRRDRVESSLINLISKPMESQGVPDARLLQIVMGAVNEYGNGGPGSDLALRAEMRSLVDETYGEFMNSLDQLPREE